MLIRSMLTVMFSLIMVSNTALARDTKLCAEATKHVNALQALGKVLNREQADIDKTINTSMNTLASEFRKDGALLDINDVTGLTGKLKESKDAINQKFQNVGANLQIRLNIAIEAKNGTCK